jgi:hypothetical protein
MRFDRSDVSSLTAIAVGGMVALLGTGTLMARADDSRDQRVEVRRVEVTEARARGQAFTAEVRTGQEAERIRVDVPSVRLSDGPVIYIDGVRMDVSAEPNRVLDGLDARAIETVTVLEAGAGGRSDAEVHIELKPR